MLTLYYKTTCPFSRRVIAVIDRMQLQVELMDAEDGAVAAELMARAGKIQVPYFVDSERGVEMAESDEIVAYLQTTYGKPTAVASRPRVQISDNVCVSCEG